MFLRSFRPLRPSAQLAGAVAAAAAAALFLQLPPARSVNLRDIQIDRDVVYGQAGGEALKLDVYQTPTPGVRPAIIFVHGGGWSGGDKQGEFTPAAYLATLGYEGFSVDYRLVKPDRDKYPAQIDDVQRAVRWVRAHSAKYHIDPRRIGAMGESAGGHLVALLGVRDTRDNTDPALAHYSSKVECVVDLFGPTDFTETTLGVSNEAREIVLNFFGKTPQEAPRLYRDASPVLFVNKHSAPFLIFHGTADPLVPIEQSERLYAALKRAHVEATLVKFSGEGHGFHKPADLEKMKSMIVAFFGRHLKP